MDNLKPRSKSNKGDIPGNAGPLPLMASLTLAMLQILAQKAHRILPVAVTKKDLAIRQVLKLIRLVISP